MTENQKLRAELLRIDGKNTREIEAILGVPEEEVELNKPRRYKKSIFGVEASVFPERDAYMHFHRMTRMEFSERCGISYSTMLDILIGDFPPSKKNSDKILAATGLTYEIAFREVKNVDRETKRTGDKNV